MKKIDAWAKIHTLLLIKKKYVQFMSTFVDE